MAARRRGRACIPAVVAAFLCVAAGLSGCAEIEDPLAADEMHDFADPTSTEPATPYDAYLLLADQLGGRVLSFNEAEQESRQLCSTPAAEMDPPGGWSPTETALVRAYCPELEVDALG